MMDVSLKALNYFLTAVEVGTITGAAKELNVVPSAVFSGVNQVEEAFGLKLTTRHRSRGISLTATGHELKPKIQNLLEEYHTLLSQGSDLRSQLTGTLRIGYYAPIAPAFMPTVLAKLYDGSADIDVKLIDCDDHAAQEGLVAGTFDVIVCFGENMRPEVTYQTLIELPAYILVAADHRLASRASVRVSDLDTEPLVLLDLPNISEYYRGVFDQAHVTPRVVATATNVEMVRSLVAGGTGCSLLHMQPLTDVAYNGQTVVAIPVAPSVPPLRIAIGYFSDSPRRLVRAFIDECLHYFSSKDAQAMVVS